MNVNFEKAKVIISDFVKQNPSEFGSRFAALNIASLAPNKSTGSLDVISLK